MKQQVLIPIERLVLILIGIISLFTYKGYSQIKFQNQHYPLFGSVDSLMTGGCNCDFVANKEKIRGYCTFWNSDSISCIGDLASDSNRYLLRNYPSGKLHLYRSFNDNKLENSIVYIFDENNESIVQIIINDRSFRVCEYVIQNGRVRKLIDHMGKKGTKSRRVNRKIPEEYQEQIEYIKVFHAELMKAR